MLCLAHEQDELLTAPRIAVMTQTSRSAQLRELDLRSEWPNLWSPEWVFAHVARSINQSGKPTNRSPDFVCWVFDADFGDELLEHLRDVATPAAFDDLRRCGLIGEAERDEAEID